MIKIVVHKHNKVPFNLIFGAILFFLASTVMWPSLRTDFAMLDDAWMVYNNPYIQERNLESIKQIFTAYYNGQYSPLNSLAYMAIYELAADNPMWYHLFNIVLHAINTVLVFFLLQKLQWNLNISSISDTSSYEFVPLFTAVLFAIHPVQVEAVAWISASKVVLYSAFFLGSLLCYLFFLDTRNRRWYILSLLLFLLSFGAKEQSVVLPLCLLAIDYYLNRDLGSKRVWKEKVPYILVAFFFCIVSWNAQQHGFSERLQNEYYPFWQRAVLACYSMCEYLFKMIIPINLSHWYPFPMAPGGDMPLFFWLYPFVILTMILLFFNVRKRENKWIMFGVSVFLINVFLALHLLPMARGALIADRYIYIACIGIFYIISILIFKFISQLKCFKVKLVFSIFTCFYLFYLASYCWNYSGSWVYNVNNNNFLP